MQCESAVRNSVIALAIALNACSGIQSALDPKGPKAAGVLHLTWFLVGTATVVYVVVVAMLFYVLRRGSRSSVDLDHELGTEIIEHDRGMKTWVVAGTVLTTIILIGFVFVDLSTARSLSTVGGAEPLRIDVVGHQWWWEVKYPDPDPQNDIETANEIHVPVGRAVLIKMKSGDVIHSFWAPNVQGKRDLMPGYDTDVMMQVDKPGRWRGQCAEYCGLQHAHMSFYMVAESMSDFDKWLASQSQSAVQPTDSQTAHGQQVFLSHACIMCHAIGGTTAGSRVGPDLTHLASRSTIAAGMLPNTRGNLAGWILNPQSVKPGCRMPPNPMPGQDLQDLLAYLETLR